MKLKKKNKSQTNKKNKKKNLEKSKNPSGDEWITTLQCIYTTNMNEEYLCLDAPNPLACQ